MTRVLVVEDDPQLVRALRINLQARRFEVEEAGDGSAALWLAAARKPDVIVLDLGLPDMDGIDVIKGVRGWSEIPILVLSARHTSENKIRALDAGADDYVTKPFSTDELLARLRVAARRQEAPAASQATEVSVVTPDEIHHRPGREEGVAGRAQRTAHPDRMAPGEDPDHPPRSSETAAQGEQELAATDGCQPAELAHLDRA